MTSTTLEGATAPPKRTRKRKVGDTSIPTLKGLHIEATPLQKALDPTLDADATKKDFRVFLAAVWRFLGLPDPTPIQLSIAQFLQHGPPSATIMAFRGAAKSFITMAFSLFTLHVNPQAKVLVVSGSLKRAAAFTYQALNIIRGMPLLQYLIPGPNQRQSGTMFDVAPARPDQSSSFMAAGITGQIVGFRADLIIGDDVETNTNSLTVAMREKLSDSIKEFDAIIKPGGMIKFLGTPQTSDSIYNKLPDRGYVTRIWPIRFPSAKQIKSYGALLAPFIANRATPDKVGTSTEPTRFDDADIAKREMSWGRSGFALQFMLDTSLSDANKYPLKLPDLMVMGLDVEKGPDSVSWGKDDRLKLDLPVIGGFGTDGVYKPASVSDAYSPWEDVRATIDPSGDGEDETAMAVVAKLNGRLFCLYVNGWLNGYGEPTLRAIAKACVQYHVRRLRIESNFGGGMFMNLLRPILIEEWKKYNDTQPASRHGGTTLEEERAARVQKELRIIEDLEPVLNQHRLVMARRVIEMDYATVMERDGEETKDRYSLFHQMTNLTRDKDCLTHDDRIEVLGSAVGLYREELGVNPDDMAGMREEDRLIRELEELFDDADAIGGYSRAPNTGRRPHAAGRRRTGW